MDTEYLNNYAATLRERANEILERRKNEINKKPI